METIEMYEKTFWLMNKPSKFLLVSSIIWFVGAIAMIITTSVLFNELHKFDALISGILIGGLTITGSIELTIYICDYKEWKMKGDNMTKTWTTIKVSKKARRQIKKIAKENHIKGGSEAVVNKLIDYWLYDMKI